MTDAVVVGGGLAGLAAAVAVAKAGLRTVHLVPKGPPDRRTSALMLPSVDYLRTSGLVPDPANVKLAEAFEAARAGLTNLLTIETTLDDLAITPERSTLKLGNGDTLTAKLVVGADGKKSRVRESAGFRARENGFTQAALVCDLGLERPIGSTSIEFHYENGPFTLVPPGGNRANLVWIDERDTLKAAQESGKEKLAALFREKSQRLFGTIELLTPAHMFLLSTLTVDIAGKDGVVLVGESAHAFPPIGAQGLNLGLRDVADLSAALAEADLSAPDFAVKLSADYARRRAADLARTGTLVDALFRSLLADFLPTQAVRAGGLWALKLVPPLRKTAFDIGMGVR